MNDFVSCVAIDIINYDKPPASLAFLAGVCEATLLDYQCFSLNSEFLDIMSMAEYNLVYTKLKQSAMEDIPKPAIDSIDRIINQIKQCNTTIVAVSIFSYLQYPLAEVFLKKLKALLPNVTVIAGGPGIQANHSSNGTIGKNLLDHDLIDYYCLGEGDEALVLFFQGNRNILGINGKQNKYETWVPQIDNLDSKYVIPSYKKIPLKNYQNLENKKSTVFSLSTSRGCVRDCAFCDVGKSWPKFRFRKGSGVAQEILQHHTDVGATNFTIVDSLINGSLKSFREFNQEMIKLKKEYPSLNDFSYNGMFIVRDRHTHNEEFFRLMKEAGCESLAIGVETGSDRLRFEMNKKFTNQDLDWHLEMSQRYGIRNNFLMFVGYPTETADDFAQTLSMLERYQKYLIDDTIIGINHAGVFSILPDTPVFDNKDNIGITVNEQFHTDSNISKLHWFNHNNPDLTVKERILRDLKFRKKAIELRYPVPYVERYLEYLKHIDKDLFVLSD